MVRLPVVELIEIFWSAVLGLRAKRAMLRGAALNPSTPKLVGQAQPVQLHLILLCLPFLLLPFILLLLLLPLLVLLASAAVI